jgi:flagellar basal-body rod modification protein FlgD
MSTTNPISQALTNSTAGGATKSAGQTLGKDDFLKLLVGQLQHQDPMAPSDDQQWIGQMAQFSQLEQVTNIASSSTKISDSLDRSGSLALIGRTVTYADAEGAAHTGTVQQVDVDSKGASTLTVDGTAGISTDAVSQVR